jgi:hypothetical protein
LISGVEVSATDFFAGFDGPRLLPDLAVDTWLAGLADLDVVAGLSDLVDFVALAEVFFAASSFGETFDASDDGVDAGDDAAFFTAAALAGADFGDALADATLAGEVADFAEVVSVFAEVFLAVAAFAGVALALREPAALRAADCDAGGVSELCCSD